jgi:hypothetical protein
MIRGLIPESILQGKDHMIRERVKSSNLTYAVDMDNEYYGAPFRYFLLFFHWPCLLESDVPDLDSQLTFYNAYYWFIKFSKVYMAMHGHDTGLEQQAFQILEKAEFNIDWEMIKQIEHQVEEETEKIRLPTEV